MEASDRRRVASEQLGLRASLIGSQNPFRLVFSPRDDALHFPSKPSRRRLLATSAPLFSVGIEFYHRLAAGDIRTASNAIDAPPVV